MITNTQVSSGYQLITSTPNGCTITWDIDDAHISNLNKNILTNNSSEEIKVKVFATIKYGSFETEEIPYELVIEANTNSSDFDEYYASIEGVSDSALKQALRTLITDTHHTYTSYDGLKEILQEADEDPNNPNNMILFYTGDSVPKTSSMSVWNREHVWAQSLGWFTESKAGSDAHHIRPCIPNVNSSRGNKKFGTSTTNTYYYPSDEFKGDVARIIFYLMTRYTESDSYSFTSIAVSVEVLLQWNQEDPVSALEMNRNDVVEEIQGNRNPFIDYPEFAEKIWG